jgi:hypothetical protein
MKTNSIEKTPETNKESKKMTRAEALKKAGKLTLAGGAMLVLLNTPEKALAQSAGPGPHGGG